MTAKIRKLIYYFIIIQPFLDFYCFYHGPLANLLPLTLPSIIRILALAAILGMFLSQKNNWQQLGQKKWLLLYLVLLLLYSLLHLVHAHAFVGLSPDSYGYSLSGECFYLLRMAMPLCLIYFTAHSDFSAAEFRTVILSLSLLFAGIIAISDLFCLSLRSYGDGRIAANIFQWFFANNYGYSHLAAKGFFNFANMVSAVLLMLWPLVIYYLYQSFNWLTVIASILQALAMLMLGTKVALAGLLFGLVIALIVILGQHFIFKNLPLKGKVLLYLLLVFIAAGAMATKSPAIERYRYEQYLAQHSDHDTKKLDAELAQQLKSKKGQERRDYIKGFIGRNYQQYSLNERFIKQSYPYWRDPDFWLQIMKEPGSQRLKNRHLEEAMLQQVVKTNHNALDPYLGIAYMRQAHIFTLERDFTSQYYSLGIIGVLLFLGPYLLVLLSCLWRYLKQKQQRTFFNTSLLLAVLYLLAAAVSSGNVLDFPTANLILAFTEGFLWQQLRGKTRQKKNR